MVAAAAAASKVIFYVPSVIWVFSQPQSHEQSIFYWVVTVATSLEEKMQLYCWRKRRRAPPKVEVDTLWEENNERCSWFSTTWTFLLRYVPVWRRTSILQDAKMQQQQHPLLLWKPVFVSCEQPHVMCWYVCQIQNSTSSNDVHEGQVDLAPISKNVCGKSIN